ncbi:MAG: acyl carrier protein [Nitrospirota bacterium]|jgi:acyl carrier protein|nr:acyl carrier protein [Nitrospirota bacterium]
MSSIETELRKYILDKLLFGRTEVALSGDASFLESGIIDSTGVLELVSFLEEQFQVKVEDEDLIPANLDSINAITRYVEKKRK